MPDIVQVRRTGRNQYQAPEMRLGRSQIRMTPQHKTTFDAGNLVPYFLMEIVPGDTVTCDMLSFLRVFSPLDAPIMDNIEAAIDFFFVPKRIVWDNWEAFLGAHDDAGAQDMDFTVPVINSNTTLNQSDDNKKLYAYLGIPYGLNPSVTNINALPLRAYALIYNEWYRDQNLIDSVTVNTDNGPDAWNDVDLYKSAKRHDYFTSALPYLQKGDAVSAQFPVSGIGIETTDFVTTSQAVYEAGQSAQQTYTNAKLVSDAAAGNQIYIEEDTGDFADRPAIYANITINELREAAAIQRLLERDARAGTRYTEVIRAHFGVDVPDYRLQRPEYLGGGRGFINVTPIANTSPVDSTASPDGADWNAGQLAATAAGTLRARWAKSFVEHGYVLGILRARGDVTYQQGLERLWSRSTKYDFLYPELSMLGEQPIYNRELWIEGDSTDDDVFGYQERYADYRFKKSLVTGKFVSDIAGSLDYWHLAEDFANQPSLNQTFIEDQTPMSRVTVVTKIGRAHV